MYDDPSFWSTASETGMATESLARMSESLTSFGYAALNAGQLRAPQRDIYGSAFRKVRFLFLYCLGKETTRIRRSGMSLSMVKGFPHFPKSLLKMTSESRQVIQWRPKQFFSQTVT